MTYTLPVFVVVLVVALTLFFLFLVPRLRYLFLGRPESRFDHRLTRTVGFFGLVFGQKKLLREPVGVIHFCIFWGFIVIAFGTLQIIAEGIHPGFKFPWSRSYGFLLAKELLSLIVLVGLLVLAYIRYVFRRSRLEPSAEAGIILGLIFFLILSEFFYSGLNDALDPTPASEGAFVARVVSGWVGAVGAPALEAGRTALWWIHVLLLLGFLVYIPVSKHMHLLICPISEWLRDLRPRGAQIVAPDLEKEDIEEFGAGKVQDFTRKQLLDVYACAECGRCESHCPAHQSGKALSPKLIMTKLRDHLVHEGARLARETRAPGKALIGDVFSEDEIWACTTCYSCQDQCPVQNEHLNKIIDMRRHLVFMRGEFPDEAAVAFRNLEVNGNPYGEKAAARGEHLRKLGVPTLAQNPDADILYWPGCAGAFDRRNQKVSVAFVNLAQRAGVSLAILAGEERCCGDPARRLGNEYLFQSLVAENIGVLQGYGVKKIVTQCPHCYNTLKNEYSQFGGTFEVMHHTEFLRDLVSSGRLNLDAGHAEMPPGKEAGRVTYHDSCYLGRYNGIYDQPRELLTLAGLDLVEVPRSRAKAFCCGGGGGHMWLEESEGERINNVRTDEVLAIAPSIVAVACPYCLTMLKDGIDDRGAGERVRVLDIAEILHESSQCEVVAAFEP